MNIKNGFLHSKTPPAFFVLFTTVLLIHVKWPIKAAMTSVHRGLQRVAAQAKKRKRHGLVTIRSSHG